ncbi:MAG: DEAD/DEAH box helicase [Pseudomonadota bacterium]
MTTEFPAFGLADPLLRVLGQEGYETPTPIQSQIIPALMEGRDVLGIAQTGTGKTAAFVLPLLHHLYEERKKLTPKGATVLILAPTRELAKQVAGNVETYGRQMRLRTALVVGGLRYGPQTKKLSGGVDLLIATPGRLEDLISMKAVSLDATRYLVLDEADQMLDLGFAPVIARLSDLIPRPRQTALLSATMEKKVRRLALQFLENPVEVSIGEAAKPVDRITQSVVHVAPTDKRNALLALLAREETGRVIIFARTKFGAEKLALFLTKNDVKADAIHGNKNQRQRERALDRFRDGKTPVLVATDVAARGIDVPAVSHVINFELPEVPEAYVHRIGRTGRAGNSGIAISFCGPGERALLRDIEKLTDRKVPIETIEGITAPDMTGPDEGERPKRGRRPARKTGQRPARNARAKFDRKPNSKPNSKPRQNRDNAETAAEKPAGKPARPQREKAAPERPVRKKAKASAKGRASTGKGQSAERLRKETGQPTRKPSNTGRGDGPGKSPNKNSKKSFAKPAAKGPGKPPGKSRAGGQGGGKSGGQAPGQNKGPNRSGGKPSAPRARPQNRRRGSSQ